MGQMGLLENLKVFYKTVYSANDTTKKNGFNVY